MRILSLHLDDHTEALPESVCQRTGLNQIEAVKAGLHALAQQSAASPAKLAERLGLIGCFASGAADLGRNHARHVHAKLVANGGHK